jgi:hypothetical protein
VAAWLLAGGLGTGGAAATVIHWRRNKTTPLKQENEEKRQKPGVT